MLCVALALENKVFAEYITEFKERKEMEVLKHTG